MENMENLEVVQTSENVEQTTEQTPKTYTQEEVDAIVGKRVARNTAKITKQFERKYGGLTEVLKAGTGKESVEEMTDTFKQFYQKKGVQIPQEPTYSARDIELLARAEANDIINSGFEEVVDEVERLAEIGADNMTPREKAVFAVLAEHRQTTERGNELAKRGVTEDVYSSKEFAEFASQFHSSVPISQVYDIYEKTQPKKQHQTMGSMRNSDSGDSGVKDFYTPEEARKFTEKDYRDNPALESAVIASMRKWKR